MIPKIFGFLILSIFPLVIIYMGITCITKRKKEARRPFYFSFGLLGKRSLKEFEKYGIWGGDFIDSIWYCSVDIFYLFIFEKIK